MSEEEQPEYHYYWIADDDYNKILFNTRSQVAGILAPMHDMYGQAPFVDGAIDQIMDLIELSWQRIRGKDIPIKVIDRPHEDFTGLLR